MFSIVNVSVQTAQVKSLSIFSQNSRADSAGGATEQGREWSHCHWHRGAAVGSGDPPWAGVPHGTRHATIELGRFSTEAVRLVIGVSVRNPAVQGGEK
jgi:hypothetical protein